MTFALVQSAVFLVNDMSAGPISVRDLTRKHHRLPTHEARDLLSELVTRGQIVELGGDRYQPAPATWQHTTLTLEA
jgi:hypothetical protein